MSTLNPFGLLVDDDAEDPTQLLAAQRAAALASAPAPAPAQSKKAPGQAQAQTKPSTKLPSEAARGGRGAFRGHGGRGFNRDLSDNENSSFGNSNGFSRGYGRPSADGDKAPLERRPFNGPRGGDGFHGGRRAGFNNGEAAEGGERPRRVFERRSGTGRGNDIKREGGGRANWGTTVDDIAPAIEELVIEEEKNDEKPQVQDEVGDANKEASANEPEEKEKEKEQEEKEMTLEEYEKVLEEKRKALLALKSEERKVNMDKELEAMQPLANKKNNEEFFAKLGSDKEKKKEAAAEKSKKSVSINEFLKPAEGENFYRSGGRGRGGRGRGSSSRGGGGNNYNMQAPAIEDAGQFPSLGGGK